MGNSQGKTNSRLDQKNWIPFTSNPQDRFHNVNNYASRALRNIHTNQQIQEYHVEFVSEAQYMQYVKDLVIRKEPGSMGMGIEGQCSMQNYHELSPYIYTVKRFINVSMVDLCSTMHKGLLYAKKVDLRLKEINDIPFIDQIYMTKAALQGFKILYQRMGYFDIIEEMIFIDKKGRVKVWIHPNLSQNQPYLIRNTTTRQIHGSQSDMVATLLDMIEENTDHMNQNNMHFRQFLINKGIFQRMSFYQALDQLQLYCMEERIDVLDYMPSIQELYNPDGIIEEETSMVAKPPFRDRQIFNPSPSLHQQNRSPDRTQFVSPSKPLTQNVESKVQRRGLTVIGPQPKNLYESQTDKRSILSNQILYKSNHEINQQSSRRMTPQIHQQPLTANYRQNTPQFGQAFRDVPFNRVNSLLPPRPQYQAPGQVSFRAVQKPKIMTQSNLNSQRSHQNLIASRSSAQKKNTMFKFNYTTKPAQISSNLVYGNQVNNFNRNPELSHKNSNQSVQSVQSPIKNIQNIQNTIMKVESSQPVKNQHYQKIQRPVVQPVYNPPSQVLYSPPPEPVSQQKPKNGSELTGQQVSYYSSDSIFNLDSEIAEDLKVYLGYNPSE